MEIRTHNVDSGGDEHALTGAALSAGRETELLRNLESKRWLWETYARRGGFGFEIGEKTSFDHERSVVIFGAKSLREAGVSGAAEIDFSALHEIGHFLELGADPEGYLRVIAEGSRADGLGDAYFRLYNCAMDIYVNTNTANRFPSYRGEGEERFSPQVKELYTSRLFPESDLSKAPLAVQYCDMLLLTGMGVADRFTVSPQVKEAFDAGLSGLDGTPMSYQQFVDSYLRPVLHSSATAFTAGEWQATIGQRKMVIDACLRPVFERLLKQDLAAGREMKSLTPELCPGVNAKPGDMRKAAHDAIRRRAEKNLAPADRAKKESARQAGQVGEEAGLSPDEAKRFAEAYQRAYPVMMRLAEVWKRLRQKNVGYAPGLEGHYRTGLRLDVPHAISRFPDIKDRPNEAEVMLRRTYKEVIDQRPKKLWLSVVLDLSGSMDGDISRVQEMAIAIAGSLAIINRAHQEGESDFCAVLSMLGFNTEPILILEHSTDTKPGDIAAAYSKIKADGGTDDVPALRHLSKDFSPERQREIDDGELLAVVIEVTDGDTASPAHSRALVDDLERRGARVLGIRFGSGLRSDSSPRDEFERPEAFSPERHREEQERLRQREGVFDQIWNAGAEKLRGFMVDGIEDVEACIVNYLNELIQGEDLK